jgi:hypothetical protein
MTRQLVSAREWEDLSAYLDGQLKPKESIRVELQLKTRPELRQALEELRRTRAVMRAHGLLRSPRNFTLTYEMTGIKPGNRFIGRPGYGLYPVLKLSSALTSVLFVVTLLAHFLVAGPLNRTAGVAMKSAPQEYMGETPLAMQPEATVAAEAMDQSANPPPQSASREMPPESSKLMSPPTEAGVGGMGGQIPEPTGEISVAVAAPQVLMTEGLSATLVTSIPTTTNPAEVSAQAVLIYPEPAPTEATTAAPPVAHPQPEVMKIQQLLLSANLWLWVEIGLGFIAVVTGLVAFILWRRRG